MNVTTIKGVDGPTSVFMLSKPKKLTPGQWMQKKKYSIRKKWVEKHIGTEHHSIAEVCEYIKRRYGFVEVSKDTSAYKEEYAQMRYSFMLQYAPELFREYAKIPEISSHSAEAVKAFYRELDHAQKVVQTIPVADFDINIHMFTGTSGNVSDCMHLTIEENYGHISGGASGSKRFVKGFDKLYRDIYKYYGVTEEDIRSKSERYEELIRTLAR